MKKLIFFYLFILSSLFHLQAQELGNRAMQIRKVLVNKEKGKVLVAAHRGDWRNFPENSLPAIDHAIQMGVDIVELDVQRTKDGVLILMHDGKLDRTTTGKGTIAEINYDDIKKLYLKNGVAIRTKERVPTLEEALNHIKGKMMVNLDKADRYFDEVYALLQKTGTTKQVIMKGSKDAAAVKELFGNYLDDVLYMPIVSLDKEDAQNRIETFIKQMHPFGFELVYRESTNPLAPKMDEVIGQRALLWYNTLWDTLVGGHDDDQSLQDMDKGYGYVIDTLGANIIQTDRPAFLLDYLRTRHLHE